MMTDIEIAHSYKLENIKNIASKLGLKDSEYAVMYASMAKVNLDYKDKVDSNLILVTSINPTSAGNGKTTVSIGLADAMSSMGKSVCLALREPSMGPVFGMKGGATGGGFSQVVPMENINLHFTGDFHAITSANNLLCSAIDNHIFQGNALNIDIDKVVFNRCLDLNDRALRNIEVEIDKGIKRKDKFNITAASEIMAILCMSKSIDDLKVRLGNILIAFDKSGKPIFARDLKVENAMAILLTDALKPNLVQTLKGTPALIHLGPFANIAHGCNSVMATNIAMQRADYVITEAGFGADLGAEKFIDFKCREINCKPACVVIVATIPALKLHGGVSKENLKLENIDALKLGFCNLEKHIENMKNIFNVPFVVTLNKFDTDTNLEIEMFESLMKEKGVVFAINESWAKGAEGTLDLAKIVINNCNKDYHLTCSYETSDDILVKIEKVCKNVYGAKTINYTDDALGELEEIRKLKLDKLPIIIAKTQYSLSDNKDLLGRPKDFDILVRNLEVRSGAGFIVVLLGKMLLMPGLNKTPAYEKMIIDKDGNISGMY